MAYKRRPQESCKERSKAITQKAAIITTLLKKIEEGLDICDPPLKMKMIRKFPQNGICLH